MTLPIELPRYIALITKESLDKELMKQWYHTVSSLAPSGVICPINKINDEGENKAIFLVSKEIDGKNIYAVPLSRHLSENEAQKIVDKFTKNDFDFDIESSVIAYNEDTSSIAVEDSAYSNLCQSWAKTQHDSWMKDRLKDGWRFGTKISAKEKTHPLLRQWSDLPDRFKDINADGPQAFLDMLNDQGYAVISKNELESMKNLLRDGAK